MSQPSLRAERPKPDDALGLSLDRLRRALAVSIPGNEGKWAAAVEEALGHVEAALRQHRIAARGPDGPLAEVDETRPTLARQAGELCSDHDDLLRQLVGLRQEVRCVAEAFQPAANLSATTRSGGVADFGALRQQAERLLARLQENKSAEVKLVLASLNTDIGVGD